MNMMEERNQSAIKKRRTHHHKSRNGCLECKRRRVKCDETRPICLRCALSMDKCLYAPAPTTTSSKSSPPTDLSISTPSSSQPTTPLPTLNTIPQIPTQLSLPTTPLQTHFHTQTLRTLTLHLPNSTTHPISIPHLASHSPTITHALLASASAHLASTLSRHSSPSLPLIRDILHKGYQHYTLATQCMRRNGSEGVEVLVASIILVPFAAGSQGLGDWLSRQGQFSDERRGREVGKRLCSTPRDVIVLTRGIRTMLEALRYVDLSTEHEGEGVSARRHVLWGIVGRTWGFAFEGLKRRVGEGKGHMEALGVLEDIVSCTLAVEDADPDEPLTRRFISFLSRVPQGYLDEVLPLLDQRVESPVDGTLVELTRSQAFALDIYAHWSVLMVLVEEETWWIGRLPVVTLQGMVNRYGEGFVCEGDEWWPGSMLRIWREVKKFS